METLKYKKISVQVDNETSNIVSTIYCKKFTFKIKKRVLIVEILYYHRIKDGVNGFVESFVFEGNKDNVEKYQDYKYNDIYMSIANKIDELNLFNRKNIDIFYEKDEALIEDYEHLIMDVIDTFIEENHIKV